MNSLETLSPVQELPQCTLTPKRPQTPACIRSLYIDSVRDRILSAVSSGAQIANKDTPENIWETLTPAQQVQKRITSIAQTIANTNISIARTLQQFAGTTPIISQALEQILVHSSEMVENPTLMKVLSILENATEENPVELAVYQCLTLSEGVTRCVIASQQGKSYTPPAKFSSGDIRMRGWENIQSLLSLCERQNIPSRLTLYLGDTDLYTFYQADKWAPELCEQYETEILEVKDLLVQKARAYFPGVDLRIKTCSSLYTQRDFEKQLQNTRETASMWYSKKFAKTSNYYYSNGLQWKGIFDSLDISEPQRRALVQEQEVRLAAQYSLESEQITKNPQAIQIWCESGGAPLRPLQLASVCGETMPPALMLRDLSEPNKY